MLFNCWYPPTTPQSVMNYITLDQNPDTSRLTVTRSPRISENSYYTDNDNGKTFFLALSVYYYYYYYYYYSLISQNNRQEYTKGAVKGRYRNA